MFSDIAFYFQQYLDHHSYLIPVGLIGLWRWSVWAFKEIVGLRYRPQKKPYKAAVSVVTPVYNENPTIFRKALESWLKNKPKEIIAVIDYTDKTCIKIFKQFAKRHKNLHLIITKVPGKRPALAAGIRKSTGEITALVDSDTIWSSDVIRNGLPPFNDKKVAGVATYQNVYQPKTVAQKMFDTQLDLRYSDDYPFLAVAGDALTCLSGRTAFYRRKIIYPMLPDLVHETFMGQPVISGDDKRLTYLVLKAGWKVAYQNNSRVYTPGMKDLASYIKQRLRWSRNALRADIRALFEGWPFRHPALAFFQIDKFLQGIVVAISPIYFIVSLLLGLYPAAIFILFWWTISRLIKMYPHLKRRPQDISIFPLFILNTFFTGLLKIYAFFTLNTQGWITRWDASRMQQLKFLRLAPGYLATLLFLFMIGATIYFLKLNLYLIPLSQQKNLVSTNFPQVDHINLTAESVNPIKDNPNLLVRKHVVQQGESLSGIAFHYGMPTETLLTANMSRLTNWNTIEPGAILNIPGKDQKFTGAGKFNFQRIYSDPLVVNYDTFTNTIYVTGRGQRVTLAEIAARVDPRYLKETSPKTWDLGVTLFIRSGVTLNLDKNEVTWLRLASTKNGFATLRAYNGVITMNGVKVTSWDSTQQDYDRTMNDGRSFILVKDGSRMDLYDSEIAYLGYPRTPTMTLSPYGISWRMSTGKLGTTLLTGEVLNNKFHDNYFGAYTYGATGMTWRGNEFYDNVRYGLDPHDDSNGFLVENNKFHNNGTHGLIFSKRCIYNTIKNNLSYNNGIHGIMLHEKSSYNLVENNTLYGNKGSGLALWHSSNNVVRNNTMENGRNGIRANAGSVNNVFAKNTIQNNSLYGIYLYDKASNNVIAQNTIHNNQSAVYAKTDNNAIFHNDIERNRVGVYFRDQAKNNKIVNNYIAFNTFYGIYSKLDNTSVNARLGNTLWRNRKDIVVYMNHPTTINTSSVIKRTLSNN